MDPYSLKRDNRKKFQDKQRLKHRHATPSDRKYRTLNHLEKQREEDQAKDAEEEETPTPSNEYRYHEDVSMTFENPNDLERNSDANSKAREALRAKVEQDEPLLQAQRTKEALTTKDLHAMGIEGLNDLLGSKSGTQTTRSRPAQAQKANSPSNNATKPIQKPAVTKSMVPDELMAEQDFLDDIL
ncbi:uncharacterized protein TDEL_0D06000 [Torulaspora delbrueckii]|uniref:Uncharacterized protein n=1 Tax=Torulaspora delbrueckii TaxID=4950 RepID=G8ZU90_TORDE|nr:hypothetical protein TDEL_0D06000 [Torulaspora delbrueckii]CCE92184.1 hypothetical protein TDEL_0D06000 [Torulaspora delbrueckii]